MVLPDRVRVPEVVRAFQFEVGHADLLAVVEKRRALEREHQREVQAREPEEAIRLTPGQPCRMEPKRPHRVANVGSGLCRFLLVQGIGAYDFNKL